jgi:hypothetical protein
MNRFRDGIPWRFLAALLACAACSETSAIEAPYRDASNGAGGGAGAAGSTGGGGGTGRDASGEADAGAPPDAGGMGGVPVDGAGSDGRGGGGGSAGATVDGGGDADGEVGVGDGGVDGADAEGGAAAGSANVLQYHKNSTRDGHYVEPSMTKVAAANIHMDMSFQSSILGPTYAQPLYFENGPQGKDVLIVVTEQNLVYAIEADSGKVAWQKQLGTPATPSMVPCFGNIDPVGITATPVIDAASRTVFFDATINVAGAATRFIHALSIDDGSSRAGWPINVAASVTFGSLAFLPWQNQRAAPILLDGTLYVPYGGHGGDCGSYHGWVVGVRIDDPKTIKAFATSAPRGGGVWGPGGLASDGTSIFVATGNTFDATTWSQGEAILRLQPGPVFTGNTVDYFTPSNWKDLDTKDLDLGGAGPLLVDLPGATPSKLVVALGKSGVVHLLDRANLGGVGTGNGETGEGLTSAKISSEHIITAAVTYATAMGSYVVLRSAGLGCPGAAGDVIGLRLAATSPPSVSIAWCATQNGYGSPIVTTTDGHANAIVWGIGSERSNRLMGFDGDTGQTVFGGGGAAELMANVRRYQTAIAAKGRIFVAGDSAVYAFTTR